MDHCQNLLSQSGVVPTVIICVYRFFSLQSGQKSFSSLIPEPERNVASKKNTLRTCHICLSVSEVFHLR
uniref:Uncharacterized protein n=1 Tax=Theropithecus gelada TaxID=9565 RepID=A0A8D2FH31_THEGE